PYRRVRQRDEARDRPQQDPGYDPHLSDPGRSQQICSRRVEAGASSGAVVATRAALPRMAARLSSMAKLSVIVPTLNEASGITAHLEALQPLRQHGAEVIVVDGGSTDGTPALAAPWVDAGISARQGRAAQMNAGARLARGDVLLFLHADTRLPERADWLIADALADERRAWGRFDVVIAGAHPLFSAVAWSMNARSRLTGIATG